MTSEMFRSRSDRSAMMRIRSDRSVRMRTRSDRNTKEETTPVYRRATWQRTTPLTTAAKTTRLVIHCIAICIGTQLTAANDSFVLNNV